MIWAEGRSTGTASLVGAATHDIGRHRLSVPMAVEDRAGLVCVITWLLDFGLHFGWRPVLRGAGRLEVELVRDPTETNDGHDDGDGRDSRNGVPGRLGVDRLHLALAVRDFGSSGADPSCRCSEIEKRLRRDLSRGEIGGFWQRFGTAPDVPFLGKLPNS
jgi:hypothetical protein